MLEETKIKVGKGKNFILSLIISFVAVFFIAAKVQAATLYIGPSSGSYNVGNTFSVSIYVSSADQAMNAVSGVLTYPKDKLEVTAVSKSGSVVNLWVQDPTYSNSEGIVNFEGIVLNPGFSGSGGKIIGVSF